MGNRHSSCKLLNRRSEGHPEYLLSEHRSAEDIGESEPIMFDLAVLHGSTQLGFVQSLSADTGYVPCSHGLNVFTPRLAKSFTLRVTTVESCSSG